ncbi:hypothetical protein K2Y00_03745 [Patescibacteria group bacterium]|nr:hypothetical protein [Patescibacteria group bacterium]
MSSGHGAGGDRVPREWSTQNINHNERGDGSYDTNITYERGGGDDGHGGGHKESGLKTALAWVGGAVVVVGLLGAAAAGGWFARPAGTNAAVEDARGDRGQTRREDPAAGGAEDGDEDAEEVPEVEVSMSGERVRLALEGLDPGEEVTVIVVSEGSESEVCPLEGGCGQLEDFAGDVRARTRDEVMAMLTRPNRQPRLTREEAERQDAYLAVESMRLGGAIITLTADNEGQLSIPATITVDRGDESEAEIIHVNDRASVRVMVPLDVRVDGNQEITTTIPYSVMLGGTYPQGALLRIRRDGTVNVER